MRYAQFKDATQSRNISVKPVPVEKRDKLNQGCHLLHKIASNIQDCENTTLIQSELVDVAAFLGIRILLAEASCLLEVHASHPVTHPFGRDSLRDSSKKHFLPGRSYSIKFVHLRMLAKQLSQEEADGPFTDIKRGKKVWDKIKCALDILHIYSTKWKRVMEGLSVQEKKVKRLEVLFIRHAQSESNLAWDLFKKEPFIFDPSLTVKGYIQANAKLVELERSSWQPELIVSSPLRRSLITASIISGYMKSCPNIVHPLCRERVSGADDIGSKRGDLEVEFPGWNFDMVPSDLWWYIPDETKSSRVHFVENPWEEPKQLLLRRIEQFYDWLLRLSVSRVCVVSHGSYIERACNLKSLKNCCGHTALIDRSKPLVI